MSNDIACIFSYKGLQVPLGLRFSYGDFMAIKILPHEKNMLTSTIKYSVNGINETLKKMTFKEVYTINYFNPLKNLDDLTRGLVMAIGRVLNEVKS